MLLYQSLKYFRCILPHQAFLKVAKITKSWITRKEKQLIQRQADNRNVTKLDTATSVQIGRDLDGIGLPKMLAPRFLTTRSKKSIAELMQLDGFKINTRQLLEKPKMQKCALTGPLVSVLFLQQQKSDIVVVISFIIYLMYQVKRPRAFRLWPLLSLTILLLLLLLLLLLQGLVVLKGFKGS